LTSHEETEDQKIIYKNTIKKIHEYQFTNDYTAKPTSTIANAGISKSTSFYFIIGVIISVTFIVMFIIWFAVALVKNIRDQSYNSYN